MTDVFDSGVIFWPRSTADAWEMSAPIWEAVPFMAYYGLPLLTVALHHTPYIDRSRLHTLYQVPAALINAAIWSIRHIHQAFIAPFAFGKWLLKTLTPDFFQRKFKSTTDYLGKLINNIVEPVSRIIWPYSVSMGAKGVLDGYYQLSDNVGKFARAFMMPFLERFLKAWHQISGGAGLKWRDIADYGQWMPWPANYLLDGPSWGIRMCVNVGRTLFGIPRGSERLQDVFYHAGENVATMAEYFGGWAYAGLVQLPTSLSEYYTQGPGAEYHFDTVADLLDDVITPDTPGVLRDCAVPLLKVTANWAKFAAMNTVGAAINPAMNSYEWYQSHIDAAEEWTGIPAGYMHAATGIAAAGTLYALRKPIAHAATTVSNTLGWFFRLVPTPVPVEVNLGGGVDVHHLGNGDRHLGQRRSNSA